MTKTETVMFCLAYALDRIPPLSEIRRAKNELMNVNPRCVNKVIKSAQYFYQYMTEIEITLFKEQVCTCMLSAINYRIALAVTEHNHRGYAICPRCNTSLERDYQSFCEHCGQHLEWAGRKHKNV